MFRPRFEPDTCSLQVTSIPPLRLHAWCICAVQVTKVPPLRFRAWCICGLHALGQLQTIDGSQLGCSCLSCPFHILKVSFGAVGSDSVFGALCGRSYVKNAAYFCAFSEFICALCSYQNLVYRECRHFLIPILIHMNIPSEADYLNHVSANCLNPLAETGFIESWHCSMLSVCRRKCGHY
jgi:hypothetical protein